MSKTQPHSDRLQERDLEQKVGDEDTRLNMAARAKYYGERLNWGGIQIQPRRDDYLVWDIDGVAMTPIEMDDQPIELLAKRFDAKLRVALNNL